MKTHPSFVTVLAVFTVLFTGCEFDNGIATRAREKPEVYAKSQLWQKRFIQKGVIAQGFTADMVYVAMGKPSLVETKVRPEGRAEVWTYKNYYPNVTGAHGSTFNAAEYSTHSAYQPQFKQTQDDPTRSSDPHSNFNPQVPVGMAMGNLQPSLFKAGPAQGGTMEPADIQSYTFLVVFEGGKVARFGALPSMN